MEFIYKWGAHYALQSYLSFEQKICSSGTMILMNVSLLFLSAHSNMIWGQKHALHQHHNNVMENIFICRDPPYRKHISIRWSMFLSENRKKKEHDTVAMKSMHRHRFSMQCIFILLKIEKKNLWIVIGFAFFEMKLNSGEKLIQNAAHWWVSGGNAWKTASILRSNWYA